jgi:hypothetical protein
MLEKINWFQFTIQVKFEDLLNYSNNIEEYLNSKISEVESSLDKDIQEMNLTPEESSELFEHKYEEVFSNFNNSFPTILRKSLFLHAYSNFEQLLFSFCKEYESKLTESIKLDDIRHNGIKKVQVYLKKVVNIPFPDNSPEWIKIKAYNQIRNHFAHDGRTVVHETSGLYQALTNINGIDVHLEYKDRDTKNNIHRFSLNNEFCEHAINTFSDFLFLLDSKRS